MPKKKVTKTKASDFKSKQKELKEFIELYMNSSDEKNIKYYKSRMDIEKKIVLLLTEPSN